MTSDVRSALPATSLRYMFCLDPKAAVFLSLYALSTAWQQQQQQQQQQSIRQTR
jgi:hypothetical protein